MNIKYFQNLDQETLERIDKISLHFFRIGLAKTIHQMSSYIVDAFYEWENKYNFTRQKAGEHLWELAYLSTKECNMIEYTRNLWKKEKLEDVNLRMKNKWFLK